MASLPNCCLGHQDKAFTSLRLLITIVVPFLMAKPILSLSHARTRLGTVKATVTLSRDPCLCAGRQMLLSYNRTESDVSLLFSFLPERSNLAGVQHIVLVLSGKGGVGKSTISTELALSLRHSGKKVGILDVDLCGPTIPRVFRVQDSDVHQCDSGWVPVFVGQDKSISLMSIGFLLERPDDAVVWRGPKKNALIKQFVADVAWGDLDFLIVDTPPGTSDEHISAVEALRPYQPLGAILVTTPQAVSVGDVRRELTFCKKTGLPVLGIVENMSGFVCPHCSECTNIFSKGGGEELARHAGVPFLGCVPLDPQLSQSLEEGRDFIQEFPKSSAFPALAHIAQQILDSASQRSS